MTLYITQPEIVYQVIGNWYLLAINHVSIVSRLKVSSCVNSKQPTQTLGRLQTASVVITVGSLGNQYTFKCLYNCSFFTSQGYSLYRCTLASSLHLEINCVNIEQRRYRYRGPWRPEAVYNLIIWTGRHVRKPPLLLEHCVRSLDYSTCLFNLFEGLALALVSLHFQ